MGSTDRRSSALPLIAAAVMLGAAVLQLFDRALFARIPSRPIGGWVGGGEEAFANPTLIAIGVDIAVLLALTLLGGMLVPRRLALGAARPVMALLVGVGLQVVLGLLLLPPAISGPLLVIATLAAHGVLRTHGMDSGWRRSDLPVLGVSALIVAATAIAVRTQGLIALSYDSREYWEGARLLASGALRPEALQSKRMIALQALHAPGIALGTDGIMTLGPLLLVGSVALLALAPRLIARAHGATVPRPAAMTALAASVIAAGSSWLWFSAIYLNVHLLMAALLLGAAITFALGAGTDERTALPPVVVLIAAITLTRAEAVLIVGTLLVGTLAGGRWQQWRAAWWTFGGALVAWNGLLLVGGSRGGEAPLLAVLGLIAGIAVAAAPHLLRLSPERATRRIPLALGVVAWAVVLLLPLTRVGDGIVFAQMARVNLGDGEGSWFLTAPLLLLLGAFGVAATANRTELAPARWFLILFIPMTMLAQLADGSAALRLDDAGTTLDVLLSGGGRPKWGDSVNRMWTHAAFIALFVAALGPHAPKASRDRLSRRLSPAVFGLGAAVVLVALWWRPDLGPDGPPAMTTLVASPTGPTELEMVAGATATQRIPLPAVETIPDDVAFVELCFDVALRTPGGEPAEGTFTLSLTAGPTSVTETFRGAAQAGEVMKDVCLEPGLPLPAEAVATVRGISGSSGSVVTILEDATSGFVRTATLAVDAPSLDPRSPVVRAASATVRRLVRWGPIGLGLALLALSIALRRSPRSTDGSVPPVPTNL